MDYEVAIYLFTNMFRVYVVYKFFYVFFDTCRVPAWLERTCYAGYWLINSLIYLFWCIPFVTALSNILCMLMLSLLYETTMRQRIMSVFIQFILSASVESLLVLVIEDTRMRYNEVNELNSSFAYISINFIMYPIVLAMEKWRKIRNGSDIPIMYWIQLVLFTIMSMVLLVTIYHSEVSRLMTAVCTASILTMNIVAFTLYENIIENMHKAVENVSINLQNRSYEAQLEILSDSLSKTRDMRHDMRNHMGMISSLISSQQYDTALEYVNKYVQANSFERWYSRTGDVGLDSIINYKLGEAAKAGIEVNTEIMLNGSCGVETLDFVTIIGNIIDNAIEAASACQEEKYLDLKMRRAKDNIVIYMENTFEHELIKDDGKYYTTKKEGEHGIGLSSVEKTLEKYDGSMLLENDKNIFKTHIILSTGIC